MVVRRLAYSRREAAAILGVSLPLIDGLIIRGKLQVIRVTNGMAEKGKRVRVLVPRASLEHFACCRGADRETVREAEEYIAPAVEA
jgi:hypothetical protein